MFFLRYSLSSSLFRPIPILWSRYNPKYRNPPEQKKDNFLFSELLMGQKQNISSARDTGWIMDRLLLSGKGQTKKTTLKHLQMVGGGMLDILSPKVLLLNFSTMLHYEKFPHTKSRSLLGNPQKKVIADLVPDPIIAFIDSFCSSHTLTGQIPFLGICFELSQLKSQIATDIPQTLERSKCFSKICIFLYGSCPSTLPS